MMANNQTIPIPTMAAASTQPSNNNNTLPSNDPGAALIQQLAAGGPFLFNNNIGYTDNNSNNNANTNNNGGVGQLISRIPNFSPQYLASFAVDPQQQQQQQQQLMMMQGQHQSPPVSQPQQLVPIINTTTTNGGQPQQQPPQQIIPPPPAAALTPRSNNLSSLGIPNSLKISLPRTTAAGATTGMIVDPPPFHNNHNMININSMSNNATIVTGSDISASRVSSCRSGQHGSGGAVSVTPNYPDFVVTTTSTSMPSSSKSVVSPTRNIPLPASITTTAVNNNKKAYRAKIQSLQEQVSNTIASSAKPRRATTSRMLPSSIILPSSLLGTSIPTGATTSPSTTTIIPTHPVPEFLCHLYSMVSDPTLSHSITWHISPHDEPPSLGGGRANTGKLIIHNPTRLQNEILGKYYRHSKYSSFQRQLNYFGFKKRFMQGGKKGKMCPCSFVHDGLGREMGSLLGLKRRPPSGRRVGTYPMKQGCSGSGSVGGGGSSVASSSVGSFATIASGGGAATTGGGGVVGQQLSASASVGSSSLNNATRKKRGRPRKYKTRENLSIRPISSLPSSLGIVTQGSSSCDVSSIGGGGEAQKNAIWFQQGGPSGSPVSSIASAVAPPMSMVVAHPPTTTTAPLNMPIMAQAQPPPSSSTAYHQGGGNPTLITAGNTMLMMWPTPTRSVGTALTRTVVPTVGVPGVFLKHQAATGAVVDPNSNKKNVSSEDQEKSIQAAATAAALEARKSLQENFLKSQRERMAQQGSSDKEQPPENVISIQPRSTLLGQTVVVARQQQQQQPQQVGAVAMPAPNRFPTNTSFANNTVMPTDTTSMTGKIHQGWMTGPAGKSWVLEQPQCHPTQPPLQWLEQQQQQQQGVKEPNNIVSANNSMALSSSSTSAADSGSSSSGGFSPPQAVTNPLNNNNALLSFPGLSSSSFPNKAPFFDTKVSFGSDVDGTTNMSTPSTNSYPMAGASLNDINNSVALMMPITTRTDSLGYPQQQQQHQQGVGNHNGLFGLSKTPPVQMSDLFSNLLSTSLPPSDELFDDDMSAGNISDWGVGPYQVADDGMLLPE